jgi:flagellar motor switch/type III secretory pathway protein FliN
MVSESQELVKQMESLGGISVAIRAELDQTTFTLDELLAIEPGGLLPLARPTGENIDLYAEEVLIGWGEVLLMDGNLAIRIASLRDAVNAAN